MSKKVNFVTIGDSDFFEPILISAKQVNKLYPESKFFIYDWGFTDSQRKSLKDLPNVEIVSIRLQFAKPFLFLFLNYIGNLDFINLAKFIKNSKKELLFINKVLCLKDHLDKNGRNFIFLDGDAILINRIDEVLEDNFDLAFTLRRQEEITLEHNNCQVFNAGVLFFLGGDNKNRVFLEKWYKKILHTREYLIEQTALTRLLQQYVDDFSFGQIINIPIENDNIKIKMLSCELYNYNWIEEFDLEKDKDRVKILHFKSGRFDTPLFAKIKEELDL